MESSTPYQAFEDTIREQKAEAKNSSSCGGRCKRFVRWILCRASEPESRYIRLNEARPTPHGFSRNRVVNTKYTVLTFLPKVLFEQFRYFMNMYFLLVAVSQFFPPLQLGLLFSYVAPLAFVLAVTMSKELYDDLQRYRKDRQLNLEQYTRLLPGGRAVQVCAQDVAVGHILQIQTNQRVPADVVLLRTSDPNGVVYLRTDQLDGETEWKLRLAVTACQKTCGTDAALGSCIATVFASRPSKDIHDFVGDIVVYDRAFEGGSTQEPLSLENALWANTVLASGVATGVVVYTGDETRTAMNSARPPSKVASLDLQVNSLSKLLFLLTCCVALVMVAVPFLVRQLEGGWSFEGSMLSQQLLQAGLDFVRFMILFSSIIPISLRVALDVAKLVYKVQLSSDRRMPGLQVRTSTLPEELGGIEYLLTDKTGTLTRNEMIFRKLHIGVACLTPASLPDIRAAVTQVCAGPPADGLDGNGGGNGGGGYNGGGNGGGMIGGGGIGGGYGGGGGKEDGYASPWRGSLNSPRTPSGNHGNGNGHDHGGGGGGPGYGVTPAAVGTAAATTAKRGRGRTAAAVPQTGGGGGLVTKVEPVIFEAVLGIALCHNVSPVENSHMNNADGGNGDGSAGGGGTGGGTGGVARKTSTSFQGASPDELALVQFAAQCGLTLHARSRHSIVLRLPSDFDADADDASAAIQQQQRAAAPAAAAGADVEAAAVPTGADADANEASGEGEGDSGDSDPSPATPPRRNGSGGAGAARGAATIGAAPSAAGVGAGAGAGAGAARLREFEILDELAFSAEFKRMGVLVRDRGSGQVTFYAKGADNVMAPRIARSDWLEEEVGNLAREGLRTLVVACKPLTAAQYEHFRSAMGAAKLAKTNRAGAVRAVWDMLQEEMKLLAVTAVEDRLQANVRTTLEMLRDANVKIWMLTGDKLETARVIAQNASLVFRHQPFYPVRVRSAAEARQQLNGYPQGSINAPCLILDGASMQTCVQYHKDLFMEVACAAPTVICCRCTPTQKAEVVGLIKQHTQCITAAIGDGGNDVAMIQAAHVGIGIEGKEGKHAALAADFSVTQFSHLRRLVLWHGRNCYLRSATLSQFVIHRGLIISVIQAVFSALFYFAPIPLYSGVLVVGYATLFTTGPVFSLVLDEDVSEMNALKFPELYRELQKRRYLSIKTFLMWTWAALYQGAVIMLGGIVLFEERFVHVVGITFTALIFTELIMVAVEVKRWHPLMLLAQVLTLLVYLGCIVALSSPQMLDAAFDIHFMLSVEFAWRVAAITAASTVPIWVGKLLGNVCAPEVVAKLS